MAEPPASNERETDTPPESLEPTEIETSPFETPDFEVIAKIEGLSEPVSDELIEIELDEAE